MSDSLGPDAAATPWSAQRRSLAPASPRGASPNLQIDLLVLHRPPQPFDTDVVECSSPPVHAHLHPCGCQTSREVDAGALRPLIPMDNIRSRHLPRLLQCLQAQAHVHRDRHRPRQPIPTEPIHHRPQGNTPAMEPHLRDVRTPDLMHPGERYSTQQGRVDPRRRMGITHPWCGINALSPHRTQQPCHTFMIARVALTPSPGGHPTHTIVRRGGVWLIQHPHPREMLCPLPLRLVVIGGPWQPDEVARPRHAALRMRRLDQRPLRLRG